MGSCPSLWATRNGCFLMSLGFVRLAVNGMTQTLRQKPRACWNCNVKLGVPRISSLLVGDKSGLRVATGLRQKGFRAETTAK